MNYLSDKLVRELESKQVLLFDFDGTIQPDESIYIIMQKIFADYDVELSKDKYMKLFTGKNAKEYANIVRQYCNEELTDKDMMSKYVEYQKEYSETHIAKHFKYLDELFEVVKNKKYYVVSNNEESVIWDSLKRIGVADKFNNVISCIYISKQEIYRHTQKYIQVNPNECALFEDSQRYIDQAKIEGITTIGIAGEFNKDIKADFIIKGEV